MSAHMLPSTRAPAASSQEESFAQLIGQVRTAVLARLEEELAEEGFELNFTQFMVMKQLAKDAPMTATELARSIGHDCGAMTRLLDRLTDKGYLRRLPHAQDRRALRIEMTEAGKAVWSNMSHCSHRVIDKALRGISKQDHKHLIATLQRIRATLNEK